MFKVFFPRQAAQLRVSHGVKNGEYSTCEVRLSSLRSKDIPELLLVLKEVAQHANG
jgi:hypothetical protein